jgi:hypothetical protein
MCATWVPFAFINHPWAGLVVAVLAGFFVMGLTSSKPYYCVIICNNSHGVATLYSSKSELETVTIMKAIQEAIALH